MKEVYNVDVSPTMLLVFQGEDCKSEKQYPLSNKITTSTILSVECSGIIRNIVPNPPVSDWINFTSVLAVKWSIVGRSTVVKFQLVIITLLPSFHLNEIAYQSTRPNRLKTSSNSPLEQFAFSLVESFSYRACINPPRFFFYLFGVDRIL